MVEVQVHHLKPTRLIPNSPQPLLYYPSLFKPTDTNQTPSQTPQAQQTALNPSNLHRLFDQNSWKTQWIFRYGPSQASHYHSQIHECMVVLSGEATIRFGAGDLSPDLKLNTHGPEHETGGVTINARAGDAFVIPAGVAHKTYDTSPASSLALLTPGDAHGIDAADPAAALSRIHLSGFTMMGAYPKNCGTWDSAVQGRPGDFSRSWNVPKPEHDPLIGDSLDGVKGKWKEVRDFEIEGGERKVRSAKL